MTCSHTVVFLFLVFLHKWRCATPSLVSQAGVDIGLLPLPATHRVRSNVLSELNHHTFLSFSLFLVPQESNKVASYHCKNGDRRQ